MYYGASTDTNVRSILPSRKDLQIILITGQLYDSVHYIFKVVDIKSRPQVSDVTFLKRFEVINKPSLGCIICPIKLSGFNNFWHENE